MEGGEASNYITLEIYNDRVVLAKKATQIGDTECIKLVIDKILYHKNILGYVIDNVRSKTGIEIDLQMQGQDLRSLSIKSIICNVCLQSNPSGTRSTEAPNINIFDVMMGLSKKYNILPDKRQEHNAKDRLYNQVIVKFKELNIGFLNTQVNTTGVDIVKTLTNLLWYIDAHYKKITDRSLSIPEPFCELVANQLYNNPERMKKKAVPISADDLYCHIEELVRVLSHPWFTNTQFCHFFIILDTILKNLKKYHNYLQEKRIYAIQHREAEEPVRAYNDNWVLKTLEHDNTKNCPKEYKLLFEKLLSSDEYEPVTLNQFEPSDRFLRRNWINNLSLPVSTTLYRYSYGNNLGTVNFLWKMPNNKEYRNPEDDVYVINNLKENIKSFVGAKYRKDFCETFYRATKVKPAIIRNFWKTLTGDNSSPANQVTAEIDERVCQFLLQTDDSNLILDFRTNNGKNKNPEFDAFWSELDKYLDEISVVDDRRKDNEMYLPFAISVNDLCCIIKARLSDGAAVPSAETVRLQFWPTHPQYNSAIKYTGRFNVKYSVQRRLMRLNHEDADYCMYQFSMLKRFAVENSLQSNFFCEDDKAVIPIGAPGLPVGSVARSHNRSLTLANHQLSAADHDYHLCGLIPSVIFSVAIPSEYDGSFYSGQVIVINKDKIYEPSSPLRHAVETANAVLETEDGILDPEAIKPIFLQYTDGGPDHRSTFNSVKLSHIALFMSLNLDMLISCRTAPHHSYRNPAERIMADLNLALQNCALAREVISDPILERRVNSCNSLNSVRKASENYPEVRAGLLKAMEPSRKIVNERFRRLKRKDVPFKVYPPAMDEEMDLLVQMLKEIEPEIERCDVERNVKLDKWPNLKSWMQKHGRFGHYMIQLKKCDDASCAYCKKFPPRLAPEDFADLHWLPYPMMDKDDQYKSYDELVASGNTTEECRPSLKSKPSATENDKKNSKVLISAKSRLTVVCSECGKARVVYSPVRLTCGEIASVKRREESVMYSCGSPLFDDDHPLFKYCVVREGLNCETPIETQYYAGCVEDFPPICFYCGNPEIFSNEDIDKLKQHYGIVRPICKECVDQGKVPATRNSYKVGSGKKRN